MEFKANIIIRGYLECLTGMHVGGSKDKIEIGGVDSPVIRDPFTKYPFIPGSSLKGKMRAMLEYALNKVHPKGEPSEEEEIVRVFGTSADKERPEPLGPTRLMVRDCQPTKKTIAMWQGLDSELLYTEYKGENGINRLTSMANPRFVERVVAGSQFHFELIYSIFEGEKAHSSQQVKDDLNHLLLAMRLLEHSAMGKSGSRGYGKIRFILADPLTVTADAYKTNGDTYQKAVEPLAELDITKSEEELKLPKSLHLLKDLNLTYA